MFPIIISGTNPAIPSSCSYFDASCSDSLEFCVLMCKGPAVPYSLLVRYTEGQFIPGGWVSSIDLHIVMSH